MELGLCLWEGDLPYVQLVPGIDSLLWQPRKRNPCILPEEVSENGVTESHLR